MTPELAHTALSFLARVDIKGAEAPALMQLVAALDRLVNPSDHAAEPVSSKSKPSPRG